MYKCYTKDGAYRFTTSDYFEARKWELVSQGGYWVKTGGIREQGQTR